MSAPTIFTQDTHVRLAESVSMPPCGVFPDGLRLSAREVDADDFLADTKAFYIGESNDKTVVISVAVIRDGFDREIDGFYEVRTADTQELDSLSLQNADSLLQQDIPSSDPSAKHRLTQSTFVECEVAGDYPERITAAIEKVAYNHVATHHIETSRQAHEQSHDHDIITNAVASLSDALLEETEVSYVAVRDKLVACARTTDHDMSIDDHIAKRAAVYQGDDSDGAPWLRQIDDGGVAFATDFRSAEKGDDVKLTRLTRDDADDDVLYNDVVVVLGDEVRRLNGNDAAIEECAESIVSTVAAHEDDRLWSVQIISSIEPDGTMPMVPLTKGDFLHLGPQDDRNTMEELAEIAVDKYELEPRQELKRETKRKGVTR